MMRIFCKHQWRVLATTRVPPVTVNLDQFRGRGASYLEKLMGLAQGGTNVLVCCDKCGATEVCDMPGERTDKRYAH